MKSLLRTVSTRAARKPKGTKSSKLTPAGSLAFARGTRTGNGGLTGIGALLLVLGAARRRSKRGELIFREKLKPGRTLRIALTTRDGRVTKLD